MVKIGMKPMAALDKRPPGHDLEIKGTLKAATRKRANDGNEVAFPSGLNQIFKNR